MVTKAFIVEIPSNNSNYFKVRIPLMEDNTGSEAIFNALLCTAPENFNGYSVGDCVYVTFEDDKLDSCIILGKLFIEIPKDSSSYTLTNELNVTGNASLPASTKIGDYTAQDITNLYNSVLSNTAKGSSDEGQPKGNYVEYIKTERGEEEIYFDKVQCMSGEEYDLLEKLDPHTMYWLSSVPPSELV